MKMGRELTKMINKKLLIFLDSPYTGKLSVRWERQVTRKSEKDNARQTTRAGFRWGLILNKFESKLSEEG